jgi:hypothetical protein
VDLFKVSIVTWPANDAAHVSSVKQHSELAELVALINRGTDTLRGIRGNTDRSGLQDLLASIERTTTLMKAATYDMRRTLAR